jgi:hypothetical protein
MQLIWFLDIGGVFAALPVYCACLWLWPWLVSARQRYIKCLLPG